jgi:hypothetical protein
MTQEIDFSYYVVTENDVTGESAHGPYTMTEAESAVQIDEKIITREQFRTMQQQIAAAKPDTSYLSEIPVKKNSPYPEKMLREIRSWGILLLIIGVIQVVSAEFLSNTWGLLLIIVGLASFYFRSPAMFVVYGTTLSWAAVSNALSGAGTWGMFSILQVFFAFLTFRQYFQFRSQIADSQFSLESTQEERLRIDKAAKPFPWISFSLGSISLLGMVTVIVAIFLYVAMTNSEEIPAFLIYSEGLTIDFAVLGFATGLASLLTKYKFKVLSIIGMVTGILVLMIEIALFLFG